MPDSNEKGANPPAAPVGTSSHIANVSDWRAVCVSPDYCKVGPVVVGFDSWASLDQPVTCSPNTKANSTPIYRVGDMAQGIQADGGGHVISGTSLSSGYVKFLTGQNHYKVNGLPVVRHDSRCLINCDAAGNGGTPGKVVTKTKTVAFLTSGDGPPFTTIADQVGDESKRVFEENWKSLKAGAVTLWQAVPGTSEAAVSNAARQRIVAELEATLTGLATLIGPDADIVQAAYLSGDPDAIRQIQEMQYRQGQAVTAIADHIKQSWVDAKTRNGVAGATAMVLTSLGIEVVGAKGLNVVARAASRVAEIVTAARTPLEAAALLQREIDAAKLAKLSAEEIHIFELARDDRLAVVAVEAKAAEEAVKNGVHIKRAKVQKPSTTGAWKHAPNIETWESLGGRVVMNEKGGLTYINKEGISIPYDSQGFPDFSKYSVKTVELPNVSGENPLDFRKANEMAGFPNGAKSPPGYTWHHVPNSNRMELVPREIHKQFTHLGSASQARTTLIDGK